MNITRRDLFKMAGVAALGAAVGQFTTQPVEAAKTIKLKAAPYFTDKLDAAHLIKLYNMINGEIIGKVGIKLHTGEPHGSNILPRDWVQKFQAQVPNSNIIETNTMYPGPRMTTEGHREVLKTNGWTFCPVDIMDAEGAVSLPVRNYFHLPEVSMGKSLVDYDSVIVLTHFKGHASGGFGGSLKNIAIGMSDGQIGKRQVHNFKKSTPPQGSDWHDGSMDEHEAFMENMADSGKATCDYFGKRIVFLNVMRRLSVDCDCAGTSAKEPTMADVGILASTDILAIDQACCDFVYSAPDSKDLRERIESRHGLRQLSAMAEHKMGNPQYELIYVD